LQLENDDKCAQYFGSQLYNDVRNKDEIYQCPQKINKFKCVNTHDISLPFTSQKRTQGAVYNVESPNTKHECQNVHSGEKLIQIVRFLYKAIEKHYSTPKNHFKIITLKEISRIRFFP
jgi:hypothetical protein